MTDFEPKSQMELGKPRQDIFQKMREFAGGLEGGKQVSTGLMNRYKAGAQVFSTMAGEIK